MNEQFGGKITIGDTLEPQLMKQREALLERIDFAVWDADQSRKLYRTEGRPLVLQFLFMGKAGGV